MDPRGSYLVGARSGFNSRDALREDVDDDHLAGVNPFPSLRGRKARSEMRRSSIGPQGLVDVENNDDNYVITARLQLLYLLEVPLKSAKSLEQANRRLRRAAKDKSTLDATLPPPSSGICPSRELTILQASERASQFDLAKQLACSFAKS